MYEKNWQFRSPVCSSNGPAETQPRVAKIEADMLHLSAATPLMSGGKKTMPYLSWRRAEANV
jgi:hypothetical protein